jgi:VWFA-related protein
MRMARFVKIFLGALWCFLVLPPAALAQTKPEPRPGERDDVIRVNTELVQTDVMVFDKKGHFVSGIKPEEFALKIDNKPRTVSFSEEVTSANQAQHNQPQTTGSSSGSKSSPTSGSQVFRGRTVIFFVDDFHLSPASLVRTRKALLEFIDHGMAERDQVAITSASGQIGFLQQFTDDRIALRTAVARLNYRANTKIDMENPPMSEYAALKIREGDEQTITYYSQIIQQQNCFKVNETLLCTVSAQSARQMVKERAQAITLQAAPETDNTLRLLEGLMRSAGQLSGRKLVFLISDGFYLSDFKAGSRDRIKRITDAAGRAGVVIYTLDARGIISEALDATNDRPIDSKGLTTGSIIGEVAASQDGLNALAGDTGGRAFRNTNAPMSEWVDRVLDETSRYYLLAWRPDGDEQKRGKFNHIEASIIGRPDLTVRLRGSYFKTAPLPILSLKKKTEKDPEKEREDDLRLVIDAPVSQRDIPTELTLSLAQMPGIGTQVSALIEINREALSFDLNDGSRAADVDIGGIFYNDKGKPLNSFVGRLKVFPMPENASQERRSHAVYAFHAWLPAGLYQVRVGVRDLKSGRIGSAMQWIQVPNLSVH